MALIQNPSIARKLQRALRLIGLPDSVLAPEIVSVIVVEDLSDPLGDISRGCMGTTEAPAVVAEFPIVVLVRVGAPARYDLVVTRVHFSSNTNQVIRVAVPTAGVSGLNISGSTSFIDFSLPGRPSSQLGNDTQGALPANRPLLRASVIADTTYIIPVEFRIGTIGDPGDLTSIMIAGEDANSIVKAGFEWTESDPQG